jgi:hypothetical protein
MQRSGSEPIAGCAGPGQWAQDYCYEPNNNNVPTQAPTTMLTFDNVYGLGGNKFYGFPNADTVNEPQIAWTCPTASHMAELEKFGQCVAKAEFFRDSGLDTSLPTLPCPIETLELPDPPNLPPPVGTSCEDIDDDYVYCYQMPGGTCYAITTDADCENLIFLLVNGTATKVYDDVAMWNDDCLESVGCSRIPEYATMDGALTKKGHPLGLPHWSSPLGWQFLLVNWSRGSPNGDDTVVGGNNMIYYNCSTWESSYGAKNVSRQCCVWLSPCFW